MVVAGMFLPLAYAAPMPDASIAAAAEKAASATEAPAAHSESGGEEESGNPLIPNPGEAIPQLVGFVVLLVILYKFGWPAITGMLDKRVNTIKDSLEQAENAKLESERLLAEHKAELDSAKKQAAQIIADAKMSAEAVKADITAAAQSEAESLIAKARVAIETEKKAAIAELQGSVADISVSVAGRLIGQDLSDDAHRRIIERYLVEAGGFDAN
jgi:F-type H+-transporting ATPase subunit b